MTYVVDRFLFIVREGRKRRPGDVEQLLAQVQAGKPDAAVRSAQGSQDYVVRTLVYGLNNRDKSVQDALLRAAGLELKRFNKGLSTLDTIITLAPLLGLLGTVTGMIHAFGLLGHRELDAPTVITGGIAEALMATAFGLAIAIAALVPFSWLNSKVEEARSEIEDASTRLDLLLKGRPERYENPPSKR